MGALQLGETGTSVLVAIGAFLIVFTIQSLFCFKFKNFFLKLLPSLILTALTAFFFIKMKTINDWDALGYAILFLFSGILLIFDGVAWAVWAIVKIIKRKKHR